MCGIIARISTNENPTSTLQGVKFLEYRGYDSYGILLSYNGIDKVEKNIGELPIKKLEELKKEKSNIEIAHTRWATHGGVTKENSRPHFDKDKKFFVVMNGIIENYLDIKANLKNQVKFISESDTEVIPQFFSVYFDESKNGENDENIEQNLINTTSQMLEELKGEFSFILKYKNYVISFKNINPIVCGISNDEILFSSDMGYIQNHSSQYYNLNDEEFVISNFNQKDKKVSFNFYKEYTKFNPQLKESVKTDIDVSNSYSTYMEKEIKEAKFVRSLITTSNLSSLKYLKNTIQNKPVILCAAGTSYYAAYYMHYMLLKQGINSQITLASELNNYSSVIKNSVIIIFSQSGETADLIYPLKNLRDNNEIFTISNSPNSTLDRFASRSIYLNCGREIGVASTKAFSFQIFVSYLLEKELSGIDIEDNLNKFESEFEKVLEESQLLIEKISTKFKSSKDYFFIGRDSYHPLALEGALKLKEISYIHAEGFAGGELKHGTLALIEKGIPVVVIGDSLEIISNATEIKTRGGIIIGISPNNQEVFDYHIKIPNYFNELFITLVMHTLALKTSQGLGHNPDKPRNLAKSVTVK